MQKAVTPAKKETVTLRHLAADLAESHDLPKANDMLTGMVAAIAGHLKRGRRIRMSGLGILQVRKRPARMGETLRPARPSRSRPARRSPSAPRRS